MTTSWSDPESAFEALAARHPRMFWLDGGGAREWSGRRSILGWLDDDDVSLTYDAAARVVRRHRGDTVDAVGDDVFTALAAEMALDEPDVAWVGYLGYACRSDLPALTGGEVPDAVWLRCRHRVVFDHPAAAQATGPTSAAMTSPAVGPGETVVSREEYRGWFARVQEHLHRGDTYELNLTFRQEVVSDLDPVTAYRRLRRANPAPYAGYLQHPGVRLLSSSPERFVTIDRDRWAETKPIKGTTPRGRSDEEDRASALTLATDPRFRAENLMIVDLLRNDLSTVCEVGSVTVPALMQVESYTSVHQLVSTVRGRLREQVGTLDALRSLFPAGSMTGAPKLRTMQIIADVETSPRGPYAGAFGWIGGDGRADLGVLIRTLVARPVEGGWGYSLGTGGGITVHSDAESEYDETGWKAARLLAALAR